MYIWKIFTTFTCFLLSPMSFRNTIIFWQCFAVIRFAWVASWKCDGVSITNRFNIFFVLKMTKSEVRMLWILEKTPTTSTNYLHKHTIKILNSILHEYQNCIMFKVVWWGFMSIIHNIICAFLLFYICVLYICLI